MNDERPSYRIPTETIPSLDLSHHLDDVIEIRNFFGNRGIETRNTRLERYAQYLEKVSRLDLKTMDAEVMDGADIFKNSVGSPFLSPTDWFLYVLREVHELMWILQGLKMHVPQGVDEKLRMLTGGRDFAALDMDSQSRNIQFELRIASYFCQAGYEVDVSSDTDIIASTPEAVFYLECKRVASELQLGKRLSEARKQLARRMPRKDGARLVLGCIAIDVTKIAFSHNGLTLGVTNEHSRDVVQQKLAEIANAGPGLFSFESCRKLLCYWVQIHISSLILKPRPMPVTRFSSCHVPRLMLTNKERKVLEMFHVALQSASQNERRQNAPQKLTRRAGVEFPEGTTFSVDMNCLSRLLEADEVTEDQQAEVVGTLMMSDIQHEFTFFDIKMLPTTVISRWRNVVLNDPARANVALIAELYVHRYPYEESKPTPDDGRNA